MCQLIRQPVALGSEDHVKALGQVVSRLPGGEAGVGGENRGYLTLCFLAGLAQEELPLPVGASGTDTLGAVRGPAVFLSPHSGQFLS